MVFGENLEKLGRRAKLTISPSLCDLHLIFTFKFFVFVKNRPEVFGRLFWLQVFWSTNPFNRRRPVWDILRNLNLKKIRFVQKKNLICPSTQTLLFYIIRNDLHKD